MSDRLAELQRQRTLVQQHLTWLDREIAAAQPGPAPNPVPSPLPSGGNVIAPTITPLADADTILSQYRSEEASLKTDVRKGCLLYASLAFALLILGVFGLYFLLRH